MANPKLLGKRMMTVNLIQSDVDVAQQLAQARGTTTSAILREAIREGLTRLVAREKKPFAPPPPDTGNTPAKSRP